MQYAHASFETHPRRCADGCDNCTATACTGCNSSLKLDSTGQCVPVCPDGTSDYGPVNGVCKACASASACKTCTNETACDDCPAGKFLSLDLKCVDACPSGSSEYTQDFRCDPCSTGCGNCSAVNNCTLCATGKLTLDRDCQATCPSGSTDFNDNGACGEPPCMTVFASSWPPLRMLPRQCFCQLKQKGIDLPKQFQLKRDVVAGAIELQRNALPTVTPATVRRRAASATASSSWRAMPAVSHGSAKLGCRSCNACWEPCDIEQAAKAKARAFITAISRRMMMLSG